MEEADKDWMLIRMVGGWVFLLVPAHPGSPGQRAVKRLLLLLLLWKIRKLLFLVLCRKRKLEDAYQHHRFLADAREHVRLSCYTGLINVSTMQCHASTLYATTLSVCLSVASQCSIKTTYRIITQANAM